MEPANLWNAIQTTVQLPAPSGTEIFAAFLLNLCFKLGRFIAYQYAKKGEFSKAESEALAEEFFAGLVGQQNPNYRGVPSSPEREPKGKGTPATHDIFYEQGGEEPGGLQQFFDAEEEGVFLHP